MTSMSWGASLGTSLGPSKDTPKASAMSPRTKFRPRLKGGMTVSSIPVKIVWQIIRSQGQNSKMGTIAESFAADGSVEPNTPSTWVLRVMGATIPATVIPGRSGMDGMIFTERRPLLNALGAIPLSQEATLDLHTSDNQGLQMTLARSPNRHMETIYRSPDDDLYLVKLSLSVGP